MRFILISFLLLLMAAPSHAAAPVKNSDAQLFEKLEEIFTDTQAKMEDEKRLSEKFGTLEPAAGPEKEPTQKIDSKNKKSQEITPAE